MKVLVCGGRDYADRSRVFAELRKLAPKGAPHGHDLTIIHGGAPGADSLVGEFAARYSIPCKVYPANWKKTW